MAWDSKGWHEFEGGSGMGELNFCVRCRFHKTAHLSKLDYVSRRLDGKRTNMVHVSEVAVWPLTDHEVLNKP